MGHKVVRWLSQLEPGKHLVQHLLHAFAGEFGGFSGGHDLFDAFGDDGFFGLAKLLEFDALGDDVAFLR